MEKTPLGEAQKDDGGQFSKTLLRFSKLAVFFQKTNRLDRPTVKVVEVARQRQLSRRFWFSFSSPCPVLQSSSDGGTIRQGLTVSVSHIYSWNMKRV